MKVLVIAPHPDDECIGVGGTIAKRTASGNEVHVCIVTKGKPPFFSTELVDRGRSECRAAMKLLGVKDVTFLDLPAARLDTVPMMEIIQGIGRVIARVKPDEVFIPHHGDVHIDHKLVHEASMVCVRPLIGTPVKRVYAYETMSSTEWDMPSSNNNFTANVYEDVTDFEEKKLLALQCYESQMKKKPAARSLPSISAHDRYRGSLVGVEFAEAFSLVREIKKGVS